MTASQFAFLAEDFKSLYASAREAEMLAVADPRGSCTRARMALEAGLEAGMNSTTHRLTATQ